MGVVRTVVIENRIYVYNMNLMSNTAASYSMGAGRLSRDSLSTATCSS